MLNRTTMGIWRFGALVIGLAILASSASASDWNLVYSDQDQSIFVDKSSISMKGKYRKAWSQWIYVKPKKDIYGSDYAASRNLEYYDCTEKTSSTLQYVTYKTGDISEVVRPYSYDLKNVRFDDIIPDTIGELLFKYVCEKQK